MQLEDYNTAVYTPYDKLTTLQTNKITNFLSEHLDQYGDKKADITRAIRYAMKESASPGGFVVELTDNSTIIGTVVVNKTGMEGYIPENILVYIAVHKGYRGKGIGKMLMRTAIQNAKGDVALHVEPDNPAKFLYEKLGFENKYLEMRLKKPA